MNRLTVSEEERVSALCRLAWRELLTKQNKRVPVSLEDIRLLMKAGAKRVLYGYTGRKWNVEVELYQHIFTHESDRYFFVPEPIRRSIFPIGPHLK